MHLVVAPDKFRGTATAAEVADRIRTTATALGWTCTAIPLADGGEGTLDAFGGGNRSSAVTGPLSERVEAAWRFADGTAVIEMATASGLALVGGHAYNDPMAATSRGTRELIRQGARAGARRIVVAVGGSACTDGGLGAIEVIERLAPFGTCHLVITGEGRLDHTSLQGKVVGGVLALASAASVPCAVIAGQVDTGVEVPARVVSLVDTYGYKCSWEETLACTDDATRRVISLSV